MTTTGAQLTTRSMWFPLMPRPRPPGLPLRARIGELQELATRPGDDASQLTLVAEVFNKAALIASDYGLPDLATALCWRQYAIFDNARPLPALAAQLALQPLLNIPRHLIRQGDGETARTILENLHHATRDRPDTVIDGRTVNLHNLTDGPDIHRTIRRLVWTSLLADGIRALVLAERWNDAAEHAATHRGVGLRLLDGRQVTILALAHNAQPDLARDLIEESTVTERWEIAVQSLLRVLCRRVAADETDADVTAMLAAVHLLLKQPVASTAVFRTRLTLIALELAGARHDPQLPELRADLITTALGDSYATRDALNHPLVHRTFTKGHVLSLTKHIEHSAREAGPIPEHLRRDLTTAVSCAERRMRTLLLEPDHRRSMRP